jgi:hypothetical protein
MTYVDEMLTPYRGDFRGEYGAYRNHVERMLNYCFALHTCSDEERQKLIIAAAFHDVGLWTRGTFDYLLPSMGAAEQYLVRNGLETWVPEIELIIDMHHKLRPFRRSRSPLVEVFRRADLADLSYGMLRGGVPRSVIEDNRQRHPDAGFHRRVLNESASWVVQHPTRPLPVAKW